MQGEALDSADVDELGLAGDRAYALVDTSDGKVASAKQPHKWRRLLELRAAFVDAPTPGAPVEITFPDGSTARSDGPDTDALLTRFIGRDVTLTSSPPTGGVFEEMWPADVEGLAPADFVASPTSATTDDGEAVSDITVAMAAPPGRFFDLSPIHVLTTSSLAAFRAAGPDADFDPRRYRPNVLIQSEGTGFPDNEWPGRELVVGEATVRIDMPTMRCVMTTLAQPGMEADRETLKIIARENRIEITGIGVWACAGAYGSPVRSGTVRVGDEVTLQAG
jgi:uncharacterized protein YcbX